MQQRSVEMSRIGVYKTNVDDRSAAKKILDVIHRHMTGCDASLDLEDCDKVLRVESLNGVINESKIRDILQNCGYQIERLP